MKRRRKTCNGKEMSKLSILQRVLWKGTGKLFREGKAGVCCQKQKAVEKNGSCELYLSCIYTKKTVTVEYIDEVLKDIEELEWIYRDYNYWLLKKKSNWIWHYGGCLSWTSPRQKQSYKTTCFPQSRAEKALRRINKKADGKRADGFFLAGLSPPKRRGCAPSIPRILRP